MPSTESLWQLNFDFATENQNETHREIDHTDAEGSDNATLEPLPFGTGKVNEARESGTEILV